jgi:phosphoribosylglycinamide formyltransferase 2
MVTLIGQTPNEFELHLRAILGLPIPSITLTGPAASAVILAIEEISHPGYSGIDEALALGGDVRLFAKPNAIRNRRMGVALALGATVEEAIATAEATASCITIQ